MLDAVVGAVIMLVASTSLFMALEVVEDAFRTAGRYPLNDDEQLVLDDLASSLRQQGRASTSVLQLIDDLEGQLINQMPSQYQQNNDL